MTRRTACLIYCLTLASGLCAAGVTDSLVLPQVEVRAPVLSPEKTRLVYRFDSSTIEDFRAAHLGSLLAEASGSFVRDYGPSQLVTFSSRGGLPAHNELIWNGIPANNPALGLADLSLLPVFILDDVRLEQGSRSSAYGSGANSSALVVGPSPTAAGFRLEALAGFESGSNLKAGLKLSDGNERTSWEVSSWNLTGQNNHHYKYDGEKYHYRHADQRQHFLSGNYRTTAGKFHIRSAAFLVWSEREQPPTHFQARSEARRKDLIGRVTAALDHHRKHSIWSLSIAALSDLVDYSDPLASVESENSATTFLADLTLKSGISPRLGLKTSLEYRHLQASSDFYGSKPALHLWAARMELLWRAIPDLLSLGLESRADLRSDDRRNHSWSMQASLDLSNDISLFANGGTHYRLPALDDLYWEPGGDPSLQSESGWSVEAGINLNEKRGSVTNELQLAIYNSRIEELIRWRPGNLFWSPENVARVHSRGLELNAGHRLLYGKWGFKLDHRHAFTLASRDDIADPDGDDAQLIYNPHYLANARMSIQRKKIMGSLAVQYYSRIYTSDDNSAFIEPQFVLNARLGYTFTLEHSQKLTAEAGIENLADSEFILVAGRPLPGRNFSFTIKYQLHEN